MTCSSPRLVHDLVALETELQVLRDVRQDLPHTAKRRLDDEGNESKLALGLVSAVPVKVGRYGHSSLSLDVSLPVELVHASAGPPEGHVSGLGWVADVGRVHDGLAQM